MDTLAIAAEQEVQLAVAGRHWMTVVIGRMDTLAIAAEQEVRLVVAARHWTTVETLALAVAFAGD